MNKTVLAIIVAISLVVAGFFANDYFRPQNINTFSKERAVYQDSIIKLTKQSFQLKTENDALAQTIDSLGVEITASDRIATRQRGKIEDLEAEYKDAFTTRDSLDICLNVVSELKVLDKRNVVIINMQKLQINALGEQVKNFEGRMNIAEHKFTICQKQKETFEKELKAEKKGRFWRAVGNVAIGVGVGIVTALALK